MHAVPLRRAVPLLCVLAACLLSVDGTAAEQTIVPEGAKLERLWNEGEFTEGVAVAPDGTIYFSDISFSGNPGRVMKFDPKSGRTTVHCADSGQSNGLMFDSTGRLIACCGAFGGKRALCEITPSGEVRVIAGDFQGKKFNAPNDLVVHPNGTIYFTDPRYVGDEPLELDHMSVYRYDRHGSVHRVTRDIEKPNGVVVSPDGKTLYVAETNNGSTGLPGEQPGPQGKMTLNAFPIQPDGSLGARRVLVDFGDKLGTDGMTVDVRGNVYAAVRSDDRHGIIVYDPNGRELAYVPTEELPTNCCFGSGAEAKTLYVTAGTGLYRIRLSIAGFHPATAASK